MDIMSVLIPIIQFLLVIGIFGVVVYASNYIIKKVKSSSRFNDSKFLKPIEYFPREQLSTLKQLYYLSMTMVFL